MSDYAEVERALKSFGRSRYEAVEAIAAEGYNDTIGPALLCAIGYQESGLKNIVGDYGHGRGFLQIDDRSHKEFLSRAAGCLSGQWTFVQGHRAIEPGYAPGLARATYYAISLLRGNQNYAKASGVKAEHVQRFAVAAYNCGAGNALRAYRSGGISSIDRYTAHGNYSRRVFDTVPLVVSAAKKFNWR